MTPDLEAIRGGRFKCRLPECHDPEPHQHSRASLMDLVVMLTKQESRLLAEVEALKAEIARKDEALVMAQLALCAHECPTTWRSDMPRPHSTLCVILGGQFPAPKPSQEDKP